METSAPARAAIRAEAAPIPRLPPAMNTCLPVRSIIDVYRIELSLAFAFAHEYVHGFGTKDEVSTSNQPGFARSTEPGRHEALSKDRCQRTPQTTPSRNRRGSECRAGLKLPATSL